MQFRCFQPILYSGIVQIDEAICLFAAVGVIQINIIPRLMKINGFFHAAFPGCPMIFHHFPLVKSCFFSISRVSEFFT